MIIAKTGLGQDSHVFDKNNPTKKLTISGMTIDGYPALKGNSDADVVLHAITNAISSITGINILGNIADQMCKNGITDSSVYLQRALDDLHDTEITHVAISIEGKIPKFENLIDKMKASIARIMKLNISQIGLTATSGEGLTEFGKGNGLQAIVIMTVMQTSNKND